VVLVLGGIVLVLTLRSGNGAAREELPRLVNSIRKFELDNYGPFQEYVSAEPAPRPAHAVDGNAVPWASNDGFDKLGWAPDDVGAVVGSYRVAATATGFTVTGTCDLDGDGERAVFVATEKEEAKAVSDPSVY
jgi:hypothetical protein